jgi:hypothetical protein
LLAASFKRCSRVRIGEAVKEKARLKFIILKSSLVNMLTSLGLDKVRELRLRIIYLLLEVI